MGKPPSSDNCLCPSRLGIAPDVMEKIEKHASKIFQGMDDREFKKFTPDMIAAVGVSRCTVYLKPWVKVK